MFTIIGGDGQEYGPVSVAQIRAWLAAGRANLSTRAKSAGSDEWRALGEFPEFAPAADLPPLLPGAPAADLAGRGPRLLARILDEVIAFLCVVPGIALLGFTFVQDFIRAQSEGGDFGDLDLTQHALGLSVMALGVLLITLVQIVLISTRGQTIGKIVFNLRIVRVENGSLPGFVHGWLLRNLVPGVIGMVPYGPGLIFSIVDACFIFRADQRCVHDLMAGTRVIKV